MSVSVQFRRGLASEWTAANPLLLEGELGLELDSKLYKIGDGITAWNSLPYGSSLQTTNGVQVLTGQSSTPSAPSSGNMKFYAKTIAGRMLPRILGPTGLVTPLQPSFFQNCIMIISTGGSTTLSTVGTTVTSVGTVSHPVQTEDTGYMANIAGAGTAGITCGTSSLNAVFLRGITAGKANGYFYCARLYFPDTNYNQIGTTTGSRIVVGMTSGTMATTASSDNPAGSLAMFMRAHTDTGLQHSNWQFVTKDGTNINYIDTGIAFAPLKVYDFFIFSPPAATINYWRIDNITDGTTAEGYTSSTLPLQTTLLRFGAQLYTVDAVVRNIRLQRIYCESDR